VTKTLENRSLGMVLLQSHVTTQLCNFWNWEWYL